MKEAAQRAARPDVTALVHLPLPYLATFGGFLVSLLIAGIGLIGNEEGSLFRLTNRISGEPVWAPEIATGLLVGWVAYKHFPSKLAFGSFVVPAVVLVWNAVSWQRTMSQWDSTWDTFFGMGCGGSECLYQLFITSPFYAAVAYSAGAVIAHCREHKETGASS